MIDSRFSEILAIGLLFWGAIVIGAAMGAFIRALRADLAERESTIPKRDQAEQSDADNPPSLGPTFSPQGLPCPPWPNSRAWEVLHDRLSDDPDGELGGGGSGPERSFQENADHGSGWDGRRDNYGRRRR